jgi:hypothetical protein
VISGAAADRSAEPISPSPPQPARLSPVVTALAALVLAGFIALAMWLHQRASVESVPDAERSLAHVVGRDMDLQMALDHLGSLERGLYVWLMLETPDSLTQAIDWYDELSGVSLDPDVDVRLAILRAEAGQMEDVREALAQWRARSEPFPFYAEVLGAAYGDETVDRDEAHALSDGLGQALGEDAWFHDRVTIALAARAGDQALHADAERALAARGHHLLQRARALVAVDAATIALGGVALVLLLRLLRRDPATVRVADAPVPPPWPPRRALAVLLRGGAVGAAVMFAFFFVDVDSDVLRSLVSITANVAALPLVLLVRRFLMRPAGLGLAEGLGLAPSPRTWRRMALVVLALVGAGALGDWGSALLGGVLDRPSHWSEWFDSDLVWGTPLVALLSAVDACVFAPLVEETVFRGILFGALRTWMSMPLAACASGLVFAAAHGYGVSGFVSVFLSALVWAWAYERTRSLVPGMIAHGLNNVAATLSVLVIYR